MRLVVVAHGTRQLLGNAVASIIAKRAGRVLGMESRAAYVELCEPLVRDVLAEAQPSLVVPLLLSTGYHVRVDLPRAADGHPAALGRALGPDPLLASAQVSRLVATGVAPGQPVVLVAAGSNDPAARADIETAGAMLAEAWGGEVRVATVSGSGAPAVDEVVRPGDAVSPYLLAPGFFSDLVHSRSEAAGAEVVADVIGPHPDVVDLVVRRASELRGEPRPAQAG
ncbi:sirohydrochlorin ferrochelatase [Nocardioides albertanoniae]|uniref:Sirohydrochlorin ferrochelatase n=1 Tax=Nocardioides albertanoniae TaxID=1175486 RepID=A0A543A215_9ACTN|nr:CbiX/SirB N-terminal domain-containing protein [Nocardioides albertanoniae]TQL66632.1 sirohydrochlorin ferrochelatase [Nocardioides albertanoniae]